MQSCIRGFINRRNRMKKKLAVLLVCLSTFSNSYAGNAFALTQQVLKSLSEHSAFYNAGVSIHEMRFLDKDSEHVSEGTYEIHFGRYDIPSSDRCVFVKFQDTKIVSVNDC